MNDRYVQESDFLHFDHMNRIVYHERVLERWHREKPVIQCACQKTGPLVEMHVRRTPTGRYTLVNNKEQSDKHRRACPFYGEVEHTERGGDPPAAVVRADDKMIVRVTLFPASASASEDDQVDDKLEQARSRSPASSSNSATRQHRKHAIADFIYDWYLFAVELIRADKKQLDRKTVLFYMWLALIRHKIVVGTEDFYYHGYVPNPKFSKIRKWKVIVGFVREAEEVHGGQRWVVEGWGKVQMSVLVKEKHVPKYSVLHKLAAVRVYCDHEEPISIAPAMAWRITKQGWFLFSDAEWDLLTLLWKNDVKAERSILWPESLYGYKPDFYLHGERIKVPVLIDVLDDPSEKMEPRQRVVDEEAFRMARFAGDVLYVPWRAGDSVDFLKSQS